MTDINSARIYKVSEKSLLLAHDFWKHYNNMVYQKQPNDVKNYIWLSVTIITALFAIYDCMIAPSDSQNSAAGRILFWCAFSGASLTLMLSVACMSSLLFRIPKEYYIEPLNSVEAIIKDAQGSPSIKEFSQVLQRITGYYDTAITGLQIRGQKRAHVLRIIMFLTQLSIILTFLSFVCLFKGGAS